jgi:putative aminopeptidase FrvX
MSQSKLFDYLRNELLEYYPTVEYLEGSYIYAVGKTPILLVAHLDTVFKKIDKITFNKTSKYYSTKSGLGADDRAGVLMILESLRYGFLPSVLFCCDEEIGAIGANNFCKQNKDLSNINIMIELDRQGYGEYVTYSCDNPELDEYANKFGLKKNEGSFSDISKLAPAYGIGAINISVGYIDQHTKYERLYIDDFDCMTDILFDMLENPPQTKIDYIAKKYNYYNDYYFDSNNYNYFDDNVNINMDDLIENDDIGSIDDWEYLFEYEYQNLKDVAIKAMLEYKKSANTRLLKDKDLLK